MLSASVPVAKRFWIISLLSLSLISLEIVWTRIFSAEFFYTFAFLVLSLALLGLGLGALSLRLLSALKGERRVDDLLGITALLSMLGPPLVLHTGLDFTLLFSSPLMISRLLLAVLLLSAPFYTGGIVLAILFRTYHEEMPKLYMADLLGAGLGVLLSIVLMNSVGTPGATVLVSIPIIIAAIAASDRRIPPIPLILLAAAVLFFYNAEQILEQPRQERAPVIYKHWDTMSKLKIFEYNEMYRGINLDNAANSPVYRFDGNWERQAEERFEFGISVKYLIERSPSCTFLSLGSGGGVDVLQALQEGAVEIHAVEVNSHINYLMCEGDLAEFSGHIYQDPRVRVVTEDGRAYVRRHRNKFDLIYSLSSNTFAALASGSFALAENYLFTTQAFMDYYRSLTDRGYMMMEHQFYMPRLVSEAMDALKILGVENPSEHIAVYDLPRMRRNILLLSKQPLTEGVRNHAFGTLTEENYDDIHLLYPAGEGVKDNLISRIVEEGWENLAGEAPFDISPCTDNRPFTAQMGLMRNLNREKLYRVRPYEEVTGFPLAKLILLVILAATILLVLPVNFLPYAAKGEKLNAYGWLYFFLIGAGFMIVEVILIQRYTLFVGPSSYTLATILLTLLAASGVGSRMTTHFKTATPFIMILLLLGCEILLFQHTVQMLGGLSVGLRILITVLLVFPLGFFMGIPFPAGTKRVGKLIDWGFAINGAASVLGSISVVLIAFRYGFQASLLVGAGCYAVALLLILLTHSWTYGGEEVGYSSVNSHLQ